MRQVNSDLENVQKMLEQEIHMELNCIQSDMNRETLDMNSERDSVSVALMLIHRTRRLSSYVKDYRALGIAQIIIDRRLGRGKF